uniref:Uncharacterized protein n=1 Tax=Magallana gigas TaxID=29159 RepID=K1QZ61_MAGGI
MAASSTKSNLDLLILADFYPFEAIELDSVYMQSSKENVDKQGKKSRHDSVDSFEEGRMPPSDKAGGGTYKKNLMKRYCK